MLVEPSRVGQHIYGPVHVLYLFVEFSEIIYPLLLEAGDFDNGVFRGNPVQQELKGSALDVNPLGV